MTDRPERVEALEWVAAPAARRALWLAGVSLAAAYWFDRPLLIGVTAVPVLMLLLADHRSRPSRAVISVEHSERCFEGEPVPVRITVQLDASVGYLETLLTTPSGARSSSPGKGSDSLRKRVSSLRRQVGRSPFGRAHDAAELSWTTQVVAGRWGSQLVGLVEVRLWDRRRLTTCRLLVWPTQELRVYPRPAPVRRPALSSTRFDRAGDHPARNVGAGVEFAAVRPFTSGDRAREVNWPVSTRRGALHVTTRRAERAVDVVVAVDVLAEIGPAGHSSRDLALTGAAGLTRAVLALHDRVGLVAVGGRLQWLRPEASERQFYRLVDALLDVTDWFSYLDPDVDTIPYPALPTGAWVVYFSPLVDPLGIAAAFRLRARGHPVTVMDVCPAEPADPDRRSDAMLALRLWRLDRVATVRRLAAQGIPVVHWDGDAPLDALLAAALPQAAGRGGGASVSSGGARWRSG